MHSEQLEDHLLLLNKLNAAIKDADTEAEVKAMEMTKDFENKHRKSDADKLVCGTNADGWVNAQAWSLRNMEDTLVGTRRWDGRARRKSKRC